MNKSATGVSQMKTSVRSLMTMVTVLGLSINFSFPAVPAAHAQQASSLEAKQSPRQLQSNAKLEEIIARLERNVPQWMKEGDVPGLSIALVRDGEVAWRHAFGVKNATTKEPVSDGTVFEAAS